MKYHPSFFLYKSLSPVGSEDYWTTITYPNGTHFCWFNIGFQNVVNGHNKKEIQLPFTPASTAAVSTFTQIMYQDVDSIPGFTNVDVCAIVNSPNTLLVDAYNSGSTGSVSSLRVSILVIERLSY